MCTIVTILLWCSGVGKAVVCAAVVAEQGVAQSADDKLVIPSGPDGLPDVTNNRSRPLSRERFVIDKETSGESGNSNSYSRADALIRQEANFPGSGRRATNDSTGNAASLAGAIPVSSAPALPDHDRQTSAKAASFPVEIIIAIGLASAAVTGLITALVLWILRQRQLGGRAIPRAALIGGLDNDFLAAGRAKNRVAPSTAAVARRTG